MTSPCGCTSTLFIFYELSNNQFDTRLFGFVFYFGLQFIITPVAQHKFLFFCPDLRSLRLGIRSNKTESSFWHRLSWSKRSDSCPQRCEIRKTPQIPTDGSRFLPLLHKKENRSVVYTIQYLVIVQDLTLRVYRHPRYFFPLSDDQFDTCLFCFIFYFGLQFIITPVAKHKFLFFCNSYLVFLIFQNKGARLLLNAEIDQLPAVEMKPMTYIPTFPIFCFVQRLLFPFGTISRMAESNTALNSFLTGLNRQPAV